MNKFSAWMKNNCQKQVAVARKLGISTTTIHDILRKNHIPTLKLALQIEAYTKGAVTVYDWLDEKITH